LYRKKNLNKEKKMAQFLMKIPGRPNKILTNIVFDKLIGQVEKMGGTLEPIEVNQTLQLTEAQ
jgi:hypothetical protein